MNDKSGLQVNKISKSYWTSLRGDRLLRVVDELSFAVSRGEAYGLIGPNGAGKTTTVKMIVGLTNPDDGEILILDRMITDLAVRQKIGFMPENPRFYDHLSAREFLQLVASLFKIDKSRAREKIDQLLSLVGLADAADRAVRGFSKGMKQRLGMAQALINDPEIIILDEPLDGLDPLGRSDFKNLLSSMKKEGKTILLSSHILSDVEEICDRIGIIDQGKMTREGELKKIIPRDQSLEEYFIKIVKTK